MLTHLTDNNSKRHLKETYYSGNSWQNWPRTPTPSLKY